MAWTEEVHRSRLLNAPRTAAPRFIKSSRPVNKTGAVPIVFVSSVLYTFIWWRKQGHKLKGRGSVMSWLQQTLEKLTAQKKQPVQKKEDATWRQQHPAALAAVAAERRLQELKQDGTPSEAQSSKGSKPSKTKKKKKKSKK